MISELDDNKTKYYFLLLNCSIRSNTSSSSFSIASLILSHARCFLISTAYFCMSRMRCSLAVLGSSELTIELDTPLSRNCSFTFEGLHKKYVRCKFTSNGEVVSMLKLLLTQIG